ncbi:MAG: peptide chain release factor N(5)-glutamine methyltransferase [bacterium]|nr:peptide chain release factor N(5)-glutamine methyltransferase [Acidimicrobiia bacterium]MCY4651480.1 peptide chain release factor N(5)-glutamine methyltransferase [bacterium]
MTSVPPTPLELSRQSRLSYHELQRLIATVTSETIHPGVPLRPEVASRTATLIRLRQAGVPLQYLEGHVEFGPVRLAVDERALIPRPETERLWELVTRLVPVGVPALIVDLGTGSGALALALAYTYPRAEVVATDISPQALDLARENIRANRWVGGRIELREGDLFEALPSSLRGEVDILVSNPPYVAEAEWPDLPEDVRSEPYSALVAGPRGTEILERIAAEASDWLRPAGTVAVEIGETQAAEVQEAFRSGGIDAKIHHDLTGRPRFVWGGTLGS